MNRPWPGGVIPLTELPAVLLAFANPADPSEKARCNYQAVWRRCRDGVIQAHRIGNGLFVEEAEVEKIAREALRLTGRRNAAHSSAKPKAGRGASRSSGSEAVAAA